MINIEFCIACRKCQKEWSIFECPYSDDVQKIFDEVVYNSDVIILSTLIYSWY